MSNLACITYFIVNAWDVPVSVFLLICDVLIVSLIALLRVLLATNEITDDYLYTVYELWVLLFKPFGWVI